ncbi:hypothetical protein pipiens_019191, partial [Culex pipiens pipiens]
MTRYQRTTEIRKVTPFDLESLTEILEDDWRTLFYLIPRRIGDVDQPPGAYLTKYNGNQERDLDKHASQERRCALQLLEEWGSSGKLQDRPTLEHLLKLLVKGNMFRAADEVAVNLLKEDPPARPQSGPAARIDIEGLLNGEIERGLDQVSYPNSTILLNGMESSTVNNNLDRSEPEKRDDVKDFPDLLRNSMLDGTLSQISLSDNNEQIGEPVVDRPNISALLRSEEPVAGPSGMSQIPVILLGSAISSTSDSVSNESSASSVMSQSAEEPPSALGTISEEGESGEGEQGLPNLSIFGDRVPDNVSSSNGLPDFSGLMNGPVSSSHRSEHDSADIPRLSVLGSTQQYSTSSNNSVDINSTLVSDLIKFSITDSATAEPVHFSYQNLQVATANFNADPFTNGDLRKPNGHFLGKGGFGQVCLAVNLTSNIAAAAVKRLLPTNENYRQKFDRERQILSQCHHPNIVKLFGYSENDHLCLVYEYLPDGTLERALKANRDGQTLPPTSRLSYLLGIASAIEYLHALPDPVIHRDVTPANILLQGTTAKLADFGLVKRVESTTATVVAGTAAYLPVEALRGIITPALDIYSFGVVMAEVVSGEDAIGGVSGGSANVDQDDLLERVSARDADFIGMVDSR